MNRKLLATIALTLFGTGGAVAGVALLQASGPNWPSTRIAFGLILFGAMIVVLTWLKFLLNL